MIKSDSTNILRSKVIDFLNSPNYQQKKSTFNINEKLTDQQKMKILKKITSESDRFQFELTYSLKNYQKATFQPPVNSEYYESVRKVEEKSKYSKEQQKESTPIEFSSSQHKNEGNEQQQKQIFLQDKFNFVNSKKNMSPRHQCLPTTFNESDFQIQNQVNPLDKYSISYQQNQNDKKQTEESDQIFDVIKEVEESGSQKENSQKSLKSKLNTSQKIENNFFPLSLTKEYKNLYKQNSVKQESPLNADQNCLNSTKNQKLQKSQALFNTIKYQQIISDPLIDPLTDDIDELSALRKRSNHNILTTKISLATPPSQIHTLVKKNNTYFFDKSNKYKKEFFVPPVKNQYLRDIQFKEAESESLHLKNQFYDQNQAIIEEQKENENQSKVAEKDEFCNKYFSKSSYHQQSYTLSTQSNRTLDQSSLDKFGNYTIQSALKSQQKINKSKQSEKSVNQNSLNQSLFQNSQALNIQQDFNGLNKTQEASIQSEELESSQINTKSQTSLNPIQNSKIIPNFLPQNPQIETRVNSQINNNKLNFGEKQKQNIRINIKDTDKSKTKLFSENSDEIVNSKESITLKDLGDFQQSASKSNKLAYDRFIFNIGEYEKNIQSLLLVSLNESPQFSRKKTSLPKIKIVSKSGRNAYENPAPGYYNLADINHKNKRGHTFSKAKKVSSIQLLSQYYEKYTPLNNLKQQPPHEETAEQYFSKLMNEVKRQVDRERRQIGQVLLKADSIQELNSIEQNVIDRYQTELIQKMIQCKRYINSIKQHLRKDDPPFLKKF
ncbi:hypothetical protein TTHERM_00278630 (macronuclear) [Tetrahymena thermophila SB210]|uniref:Uncharacterized protein n=1 Tax=Tetrahymena thermophila (strain SB210) TaxID=312017 RepID=I7LVC7_TETTS|nr:hypothetical protein TTHERM_00278630 [Tetrahymena thermophila SB210]EAR97877.1 hypothetical protein TTHERM_00278630 [Tetrahymena thermophila SB210]|eukprot:XP_001018122.1 hypothetical protein TTHERM_00278630 [Tetrahymena thermophila SB210]